MVTKYYKDKNRDVLFEYHQAVVFVKQLEQLEVCLPHGNHIGMETLFQIVHMQKKNLLTHRKKNYLTLFIG